MIEEVEMKNNRMKTKQNLEYIQFLPHRDACENVLCSTGKETYFLTDRSQPNTQC